MTTQIWIFKGWDSHWMGCPCAMTISHIIHAQCNLHDFICWIDLSLAVIVAYIECYVNKSTKATTVLCVQLAFLEAKLALKQGMTLKTNFGGCTNRKLGLPFRSAPN